MINLILFLGDSDIDEALKQILEDWSAGKPEITIEYRSIHADPAAVVRLGITNLPALVLQEEIIVQGPPEKWAIPLLERTLMRNANT